MSESNTHSNDETTPETSATPAPDAHAGEVLGADSPASAEKDPSDWVTGDEPMTGAQRSYLDTLAREAGETLPADLNKAQASEHIDRLQDATGRGARLVRTRTLGNAGVGTLDVGAIGLGLMTFDQTGAQPREQLLDTLRTAADAGVTLLDTADAYGPGDDLGIDAQGANETLVASLLDEAGLREQVVLATKGGHVRTEGGGWGTDSSAAHLHEAVDASLRRLGVEQIALWQHHRPDPAVPYDEVIGTLKEIAETGKVRMVGLSNASPDQIRSAHAVLGDALVSVQNQFSPAFRSSAPEIEVCEELGLAFLPWSPLGGLGNAKELAEKHPAFAEVARARGVSAQQVALAWELTRSPVVIPIPGAKRPASIADSAAAADLELSDEELARLDAD